MSYDPIPYPEDFEHAWESGWTGRPDALEVTELVPEKTGLFDASGRPIMRHPLALRFGFHPPSRAYYYPTLEEDDEYDDDPRWAGYVLSS